MNQSLGTISTISSNIKPEAASIYFVFDKNLNIFFITRKESRKYKNILNNNRASFVITTEKPPKTVQLEGVVEETSTKEQGTHFSNLIATASRHNFMPPVSQLNDSEMVFMKIKTTWARMGDFEVLKEGDKFIEVDLT